jgi:hypothetical protein
MVEMVGIRQVMWFVMLESAKDQVIGVDTPGQQVPPHVRYGTTCLLIRDVVGNVSCSDEWKIGVVTRLIRDVVGSVSCSDEWKIGVVTRLGSHGARGVVVLLLA